MDPKPLHYDKSSLVKKNTMRFQDVYYIAKKPLGTGSYGVVYKCQHKETKLERAVKKVKKNKITQIERFRQEIEIL